MIRHAAQARQAVFALCGAPFGARSSVGVAATASAVRRPAAAAIADAVMFRCAARSFHASRVAESGKKDYYDILGVKRDSTKKEIKEAYFKVR